METRQIFFEIKFDNTYVKHTVVFDYENASDTQEHYKPTKDETITKVFEYDKKNENSYTASAWMRKKTMSLYSLGAVDLTLFEKRLNLPLKDKSTKEIYELLSANDLLYPINHLGLINKMRPLKYTSWQMGSRIAKSYPIYDGMGCVIDCSNFTACYQAETKKLVLPLTLPKSVVEDLSHFKGMRVFLDVVIYDNDITSTNTIRNLINGPNMFDLEWKPKVKVMDIYKLDDPDIPHFRRMEYLNAFLPSSLLPKETKVQFDFHTDAPGCVSVDKAYSSAIKEGHSGILITGGHTYKPGSFSNNYLYFKPNKSSSGIVRELFGNGFCKVHTYTNTDILCRIKGKHFVDNPDEIIGKKVEVLYSKDLGVITKYVNDGVLETLWDKRRERV